MNVLVLKLNIHVLDLLKSAGQFDSENEIKIAADMYEFLENKGWIVVKPNNPYTYT